MSLSPSTPPLKQYYQRRYLSASDGLTSRLMISRPAVDIPPHLSPEYPQYPQSSPSPSTWPSPSSATSTTSPATPFSQHPERQAVYALSGPHHFQPDRPVARHSLNPPNFPENTPGDSQSSFSRTQPQVNGKLYLHTSYDHLHPSNDLPTVGVVEPWSSDLNVAHFRGAEIPGNGYNHPMMEAATSHPVMSQDSHGHYFYAGHASEASNKVYRFGLHSMTPMQSVDPAFVDGHSAVPPGIQVGGYSPLYHPTSTHVSVVLPPDRGFGDDFPPRTAMSTVETVASPSVIEASFKRRKFPPKYTCSLCGQTFTAGHGLYNHEKVHKGIKDFVCEYCSKEFTTKHTMKRHAGTCRSK
ncbi:hypothetical protein PQX77_003721 [Marasmius sp. AFHP31]|nr:hypothetical protein PQX77_003721 [Marasmius sp. AFHP31]